MKISHSYTKAYKACASVAAVSAVAASAYLLSPLLIAGVHADTPMNVNVDSDGGYHLTYSSAAGQEGININATGTPTGAISTAKDTVSISSNIPGSWNLYISSGSNSNRRLYYNDDTTSQYFISPVSGTAASPKALEINSYGYAVLKAPFKTDASIYTEASTEGTWAGVPFLSNAEIVDTDEGDKDIDIYYGAKVDLGLIAGRYSGDILYTVMGTAGAADSATISPEAARPGESIRIATTLTTNRPIEADEIEVYIDVSKTLSTSDPRLNCPVTAVSSETGVVVVTCTLPELPLYGQNYKIVTSIYPYNKQYAVSGYRVNEPLLNKNATNISEITYMQEMNPEVCSSMTLYQPYTLKDARDSKTYRIARYNTSSDGSTSRCWMMNNLSIGPSGYSGTIHLNPEYSDTNINGYDLPTSGTELYYGGGSPAFAAGSQSSTGNAPYSICPSGWRLPTLYGDVTELRSYNTDENLRPSLSADLGYHEYLTSTMQNGYLGYFGMNAGANGNSFQNIGGFPSNPRTRCVSR